MQFEDIADAFGLLFVKHSDATFDYVMEGGGADEAWRRGSANEQALAAAQKMRDVARLVSERRDETRPAEVMGLLMEAAVNVGRVAVDLGRMYGVRCAREGYARKHMYTPPNGRGRKSP